MLSHENAFYLIFFKLRSCLHSRSLFDGTDILKHFSGVSVSDAKGRDGISSRQATGAIAYSLGMKKRRKRRATEEIKEVKQPIVKIIRGGALCEASPLYT